VHVLFKTFVRWNVFRPTVWELKFLWMVKIFPVWSCVVCWSWFVLIAFYLDVLSCTNVKYWCLSIIRKIQYCMFNCDDSYWTSWIEIVICRRKVDDKLHTFSMQIPIPPPSWCSFITNTSQYLCFLCVQYANLLWQKCALKTSNW